MDDYGKVSCCAICTLAEIMKVCPMCAFSIGLQYRVFMLFTQMFDMKKLVTA